MVFLDNLQIILVITENSVDQMQNGIINWQELSDSWAVIEAQPNETLQLLVIQPKVWHIVILHHSGENDSGVMEVKVENDYHNSEITLTFAYLLSIPSLWITAWVIHRLWRMKKNGVHWLTSKPSYVWSANHESE